MTAGLFSFSSPPGAAAWALSARALVTPCKQPLWRAFLPLLAIAFAARLIAAYYGHWFWRYDEIYQYLEQAHRVVFGYGFIPWGYRYGARSWLTAGIAMPPLYLAKWLGIETPQLYATMVNSWNALLSMLIPICSYLSARRLLGEQAARWALIFTCFWYEFIALAPHTLSEIYSALFFMAALATGAGNAPRRWLISGFLMGAALALRPHYAPVVAAVAALWLWQLPRQCSLAGIAGGAGALLLWGLIDRVTLGGWWGSLFNYINYVPLLFDQFAAKGVWWRHLANLTDASFGLYPAIIVLALFYARRLFPLLIIIIPSLALYLLHHNQEYSNIFIYLPLLWIAAAAIICHLLEKKVVIARGGIIVIALIAGMGLSGKLRITDETDNSLRATQIPGVSDLFQTSAHRQAGYQAHRLIKKQDNTVLVWIVEYPSASFGGFYTLHHNIPVFFISDTQPHDLEHQRIWEEAAGKGIGIEDFATHVISDAAFTHPDFDSIPLTDDYNLYINQNTPGYPAAEEWVYDYLIPVLKTREKLPHKALTGYRSLNSSQ